MGAEVNRLDVENRQLREADTEASKLVDLQADLEQSKAEVAALTQRVRAYEEQAMGSARATEEAEGLVVEAERHKDAAQEQLQAVREQLRTTLEQLQAAREQTAEREESLGASQTQMRTLTEELEMRAKELQVLHAER